MDTDREVYRGQGQGDWCDYHQFGNIQQALRQIMNYVEFGEDDDGQVVIYTNLTFRGHGTGPGGTGMDGSLVDMDTGEKADWLPDSV